MKNIFALILVLNLNLYTMERHPKPTVDNMSTIDKKELSELVTRATTKALKKDAEEREMREQGDCSVGLGSLASGAISATVAIINYLINNNQS
jgi:hypothetical protein